MGAPTRMQGIVMTGHGGPEMLEWRDDLPVPVLDNGEVLIRVRAASLNYPDLLMTQGKYQFKPEPPFVSGLEMAGEIVEAGPPQQFFEAPKSQRCRTFLSQILQH